MLLLVIVFIAIPETKLEPAALKSCHEFPTMMECIPENWVQINHKHFYLELCSTPNFITWEIRPSAFGFGSGRNSILGETWGARIQRTMKIRFPRCSASTGNPQEKKSSHFVLKEFGLIVRWSDKFPTGSCKLQDDQISCVETELTPHPANFQATTSLSFIIRDHHRTLFLTGINILLVKAPAPGSCGFKSSLNTVAHWDQRSSSSRWVGKPSSSQNWVPSFVTLEEKELWGGAKTDQTSLKCLLDSVSYA